MPELGPLTAKVVKAAGWKSSQPNCPSSQKWADEFERIFSYTEGEGQFARYFNRLTSKSYSQFESSLAELRVAYYLDDMGFRILDWEPIPKSGNAGEFTIVSPTGEKIFVEVKSPGWESELEPDELKAGRAKQEKYKKDDVGRWIEPHVAIQFAIRKAYKKFDAASSNLLVVADDLFVSLSTAPDVFASQSLYDIGGYFSSSAYQNLGGVGLFWIEENNSVLRHRMKMFPNERALPSTALPSAMVISLNGN